MSQVALVTGGASGIGAEVARRLAGRGIAVSIVDVDGERAETVAAQVGGQAIKADVTDPAAVRAAVEETEQRFGRLDIVHLNAGIGGGQPAIADLNLDRYRRVLGVNVDHVVIGTCAAVPALRRAGGGTIVVTASLAGLTPMPLDPIYTLTKHAVVGYVRAAGAALAGEGIRLCALCPGFADTPLIAGAREAFGDYPLLTTAEVADAMDAVLADGEPGQAWVVQPGRAPAPYRFRGVPGPATAVDHPTRRPPDIGV